MASAANPRLSRATVLEDAGAPNSTPKIIYLKDYTPPAFLIPRIDLDVQLFEDDAQIRSRLFMQRNPISSDLASPLQLDGDTLQLESITLDGQALAGREYELDAERLTLKRVPDTFTLETVCRIRPKQNTALMGLYAAKTGFFTQCEAEGFRRITFFLDRPDVMARYTTTIHADRAMCPVLLSNGTPTARGDEPGGRHWVTWEDPFPKPSYLFALVAARLDKLADTFTTRSGKIATLQICVEPGKLDQCTFAMQALKKAMTWDEEVYGRELDLDHYMIVAVSDFTKGAMENKGLNIFHTRNVLARPETTTDSDFMRIDRAVAHEYFHNWTGNRVTCRDWFQLSLKEGLTTFREQEFAANLYSQSVQRIEAVRGLRARQFPEDAGPMAHPVRPQSYVAINNFYTATVYQKGAEVVRMIHTLLGPQNFRQGMDRYFGRHDGQAVTTDEFVQALQDASGVDLTQFRRWYDQAGTPRLHIEDRYEASSRTYALTIRQSCPPTPDQPEKLPFHIPFAVGLVGPDGQDIPLKLKGETRANGTSRVLSLRELQEHFLFEDVPAKPVPSLLRGFSAPVIIRYDYSDADLRHLLTYDSDPFNRWDAGQRLALTTLLQAIQDHQAGHLARFPASFTAALGRVLADADRDPAFAAEVLTLPSEIDIAEQMEVIDPDAVHTMRIELQKHLAEQLKAELLSTYRSYDVPGPYSPDAVSAGRRALKNQCLFYLMELDDRNVRALGVRQYETANNMTDAMAALTVLANCDCPERQWALEAFYAKWRDEPLVLDKWLAVQAMSRLPGTLAEVKRLAVHPVFDLKNPRKVQALLGSFGRNQVHFHAADGSGYAFLADQIIALDPLNPQVAARLARSFDRWKRFDADRQHHARLMLVRIRNMDRISKDTLEIVTKILD